MVRGETDLARILSGFYAAMNLPMRPGSVGSLRRLGNNIGVEDVIAALAAEAKLRYGAESVPLDEATLRRAREHRAEFLVPPSL